MNSNIKSDSDTIAAIATPPGHGGIGIVKISGLHAVEILDSFFAPKSDKVGNRYQSHRVYYGKVVSPETGEMVDEAIATVMLAPRTYTREDIAEINCHGGPAAVKRTLELALSAGARLAEPGEFTKRAFLNGRIDLTQAEAVMDVIASTTELSLQAAVGQLRGGLKERIVALRDSLMELMALTELSIDFPEEEIDYVPIEGLRERSEAARGMISALLSTYDEGRALREGLKVAIVGSPNVGKSSLLNLITRSDRAIVTEIPGTTRDTVEELVNLGGMPVRVIDTAGIRHSNDLVEREGIRRSEEALKAADLALVVLDGSRPLSAEDRGIIEKAKDIKHLIIINKYDLPQKLERGAVLSTPVYLSAKTGAGLDELTRRIKEAIFSGRGDRRRDYPLQSGGTAGRRGSDAGVGEMRVGAPEAMINLRHKTALERARSALVRFEDGCKAGLSQEFLAVELKDALNAVGEIVGQTAPDDVLNLIFSRFCIGK